MMTKEQFDQISLPYNIWTGVYSNAAEIQWSRYLNGFTIHNTGTTFIFFNGDRIVPGESKTVGGNFGEVYKGRLDLSFFLQTPPPGTIINQATITQKFYVFPE